jgi:hypothetical protein
MTVLDLIRELLECPMNANVVFEGTFPVEQEGAEEVDVSVSVSSVYASKYMGTVTLNS